MKLDNYWIDWKTFEIFEIAIQNYFMKRFVLLNSSNQI